MDNKDLQSNIRVVNLSNFVQPEVKEVLSRKYVTYGDKNEYFQYLIDRSRGSATNGAVIKSIIDFIHGDGLNDEDFYETIPEDDIRRMCNDVKSMGQYAIQVQTFGGGKSAKGSHIPVESLAPEKADEKGVINNYYYSKDWSKVRSIADLKKIPAFNGKKSKGISILYVKPYNSGLFYFSTVDYQGGLQYAELEEEIGNYHVNNIQNGLAPSMLINMNNGIPATEEKAKQIEKKIHAKYSGSSNAGRAILMFNDNKESESTITPIPLSDAAEQYQFLSDESMKKILVSHRVTSPLLLGLSTNTGFGSNADELKVASVLFETLVINPFRQLLIQSFKQLDEFNGIDRDLEFISLNPFMEEEEVVEEIVETTPEENVVVDEETVVDNENTELSAENDDSIISNALIDLGEDEDLEKWELIDEREVDYLMEDYLDEQISDLNNPKLSLKKQLYNFVTTGTARPNAKSEQDGENSQGVKFKVRYQYAPLSASANSRDFCKRMVTASKIYRKEDIIAMGDKSVNPGWGLSGADTYSIWLYKGGGACHHKWFRKTYVQRKDMKGIDIKSPLAPTISTTKARSEGFRAPANDSKVSVAPINMPNQGFVNK